MTDTITRVDDGSNTETKPLSALTLDPSLYAPSEEEVAFLKSQTGIQDDEELKAHVLAVQKEAWDVCTTTYIYKWIFVYAICSISDRLCITCVYAPLDSSGITFTRTEIERISDQWRHLGSLQLNTLGSKNFLRWESNVLEPFT